VRLASDNGLKDQAGLSPDGMPERYLYSPDMVFRYAFGRWWGNVDLAATAIWVLLNPATGDTERRHRPTLERCISRSRAAGYTGLVIVNLFAFRDTDPRNLRSAPDAVGPANDEVLRVITKAGAQTIVAWGAHGRLRGRSGRVGPLLDSPMCLGITQRGEPRHPLYVPADTELVPWAPVPAVKSEPKNEELKAVLLQTTPTDDARSPHTAASRDRGREAPHHGGSSRRWLVASDGGRLDRRPARAPIPEVRRSGPAAHRGTRRNQRPTPVRLDAMGRIPAVSRWRRVGGSSGRGRDATSCLDRPRRTFL
jgi:hypothetical protein